ncbi:hypothetical protein WSK_0039 [Novosphingobium sp. Rr 2-17]|uniref:hypothetical protein n=1 Tax=Novosphingobium sp. Rr 2-17 TaxID=555793 RepID=UPI000269A77F|nr:hypothetical protein [Novosphingobium sp. Rr 2-17]EIZ81332.1 hypothetical protein WSK_0039 [Novosphingobium sp. Rr 2-17]
MSEERVTSHPTETTGATHTTIIREKSGSGVGIVLAAALLIAVVAGVYLFSQNTASEAAKNSAVAEAANDVGNAANKVAGAAENAAKPASQ